jgi:hypothetical protein
LLALVADRVGSVPVPRPRMPKRRAAGGTADPDADDPELAEDERERVAEAIEAARERLAPLLRQSERAAETALARTSGTVSAKVDDVGQAGREVAQVTAGFFGSLGSGLGAIARTAWTVTLLLIKAAVLIGVAYAGWEWLQSRRQNQIWSTPSYTPASSGGPGGTNATGSPYGSGSSFPSPAGAVG